MSSASRPGINLVACIIVSWIAGVYATLPTPGASVFITPHAEYSSSVGVLGCKVDTNRIAYWPLAVGCDNICVKVSNEGRSLHLLRIDMSQGAYDISYDAWNYLASGASAMDNPQQGGEILMSYEVVETSECQHLLHEGKLPLSAANSMNYVALCASQSSSWVANNYQLYNINDPLCKFGVDERCDLDLATSNQPSCPSVLGNPLPMQSRVKNVAYGTGQLVPV
ncbi:hypothetical protein FPOAC1_003912 [Fusarium poae]|uniref:uncharacterized protein n=1 Tax=Fusarium poae TaxID=36050 RepID=UPI001CE7746A|nr:uncharacterized protein FPOAC1_012846 [Fusarium poae]XP_044714383.1 hypothetical protein FPOAC1_003912 [Fusarium poae]KAG8664869.1 hypothetical protein FPOAC1_012846 [Fusarium poae]KAG8677884.1 hypothetical protein FPOAC1_003912 [Fusarium poae]